MGSGKRIVKGVFWTTTLNIVNGVYGFIAVPILINYFGKAEYGLIGLAMSVNVYLRLMDMGFSSTNVRFFSTWLTEKKHEKVFKALQTSLSFYGIIGILNAIILLIVSFYSNQIFNVNHEQDVILKRLIYILSFSAFCSWFTSCFDQLVKATENVAWSQRMQLIPKCLQIVVLFATVYLHFSIELFYLLTTLATISIIPFQIGKIKGQLPYVSLIPKIDKKVFFEMLPYSLNIFSFSLFQFSFYNLRPVFLGIQGTMESITDFRIMNGIIGVVHMVGGAFVPVLLPSTAKVLAQHNMKAYYQVAYDGTKYISILLCFCTFGMMTVGKDVLTLYVGPDYLFLIPWFNLWLICNLVTHNQAISSLILAGSDIRAISYSSALASIAGLAVSWFLIPYYQVGGTVIGFAVYGAIQMLFYYIYYWPIVMKINSIKVLLYSFGPYLIIGTIVYYSRVFFPTFENSWINLLVHGILFAVLYAALSMMTINKSDRHFFLNTIKR